jgi:uncharacterized membrane protein YjjP (DUF1212 family)
MTHDRVAFVLKMARAMHGYGYAAHRLEETLSATSRRLGLDAQFFSTPTSIFAAFGKQDDQQTYLIRVEPGDTDLGKLAQVDRITLQVIRGQIGPTEGARELDVVAHAPSAYGPLLSVTAFGLTSATSARFLGGGWPEIGAAAIIGLVTGALAIPMGKSQSLGRIFEPVAAFIATALATAIAVLVTPVSVFVAVLGGIIVLLPGLTLTVAMTELATRHLASGTARLSSALLVFLTIIFGVAFGGKLVTLALGSPEAVTPASLPLWTEIVALAIAPFSIAVLLRAAPSDLGWVAVAGWLAYGGSRLGAASLGVELGAFTGALAVGIGSNLYALLRDRPSQVPLVPGVLLLVPGSIGFRSVSSMLNREVISGIETAFTMVFIATALVAGLLVANVVVPRRKSE